MTHHIDRPVLTEDRECRRGVLLIALITCLPLALIAVARLLIG